MAIQSVLSSLSIMRLTAPGAPSLMGTELETALAERLTTVRLPVNRVVPCTSCGFWPTTYKVEVATRALLAPPGIAIVEEARAAVVGRVPDCWPSRKIIDRKSVV